MGRVDALNDFDRFLGVLRRKVLLGSCAEGAVCLGEDNNLVVRDLTLIRIRTIDNVSVGASPLKRF